MSDAAAVGAVLPALLRGWVDADLPEWARAFVACATGDFETAIGLARSGIDDGNLFVAAQARLTLGSALRQTNRHAEAATIDDPARAPVAVIAAHLWASRGADAIGVGALDEARAALAHARTALDAAGEPPEPIVFERTRARIRIAWVASEVALAGGDPASALAALGAIDGTAPSWPRHVAKTSLFRGVALRELGANRPARAALTRCATIADSIGARPLAEIAERLLHVTAI